MDEKFANAAASRKPDMMLNFGVWGPGPSDHDDFVKWNKIFERKIRALGGQKWLYAQTFYTEDEFWDGHGERDNYDCLRRKYHASFLPNIYDKIKSKQECIQDDSWWMWLYVVY